MTTSSTRPFSTVRQLLSLLVVLPVCLALLAAPGEAQEVRGSVAVEYRGFFQDSALPEPGRQSLSLSIEPELYWDWEERGSLLFVPFVRLDESDPERTHFDVRELVWHKAGPSWELRAGIGKVFWGVTESQHLVDIINQTDLVENLDGEDKLGQPMVNVSFIRPWGTLDIFVLPGFRERTIPGADGRFRSPLRVDRSQAQFESGKRHVDLAVRWFHTLGDLDVGVSHFYGTSREPVLLPGTDGAGEPVLVPRYDLINQTAVDLQVTKGPWLWKLEAITRGGQGDRFGALTGGFEYTFSNVRASGLDLGLLFEYLFDTRGSRATTPFEDDLFFGTRLALNDTQSTELLAGVILDRTTDASLINVEASRRLSDHWKLSIEGRAFVGIPRADILSSFGNDDHVQLELAYFF